MKNFGFKLVYFLTAIVMLVELGLATKESLFTDISQLPTGSLMYEYQNASGEKTLNLYFATNDIETAIRGEIKTKTETYNIFWQTGIGVDEVEAWWLNEDTIVINNIKIDANDKFGYDCRRGYSLFDEGSLEENFTNFRGIDEEK